MNYRKLRKAYKRLDDGNTVKYTLYDKEGKVMKKASRKATCEMIKLCLRERCNLLHLLAEDARKRMGMTEEDEA